MTRVLIYGLLGFFTLYLVSLPASLDLMLNVNILDQSGKKIKEYIFEDGTKTWYHLVMLPFFFTGDRPKKAYDKTVMNMVRHFYKKILEDNIISLSKSSNYEINDYDLDTIDNNSSFKVVEITKIIKNYGLINIGYEEGLKQGDEFIVYRIINDGSKIKIGNCVVVKVEKKSAVRFIKSVDQYKPQVGDFILINLNKD